MSIDLVRVVNAQTLPEGLGGEKGSILLDKIDQSQGHSDSPPYAQISKQMIYVPFRNPNDVNVNGYTDLVQTDEVMLQAEADGSIGGLANTTPARVTVAVVDSVLLTTSTLTNAQAGVPASNSTYTGTTLLSVTPDVTYLELTNAVGGIQVLDQTSFVSISATTIVVLDTAVTGTPVAGWLARIFANSKWSNQFTLV